MRREGEKWFLVFLKGSAEDREDIFVLQVVVAGRRHGLTKKGLRIPDGPFPPAGYWV